MAVEFIYFDLGNVLLRFSRERQYRQLAETAGIQPSDVEQIFASADLENRYETGLLSSEDVHREFCDRAGAQCGFDELQRAGSDIFWVNASIIPIVSGLWSAGYRLGILSNTCASHWEFCTGHFVFLNAYFEQVVLSYEVGVMKPNPEIFDVAAEKAGVPPANIFYMDDLEPNVQGARAAGFDAVQYSVTPALVDALRQRNVQFNH